MFLMLMTSCSNRLVSVFMNFEASSVHRIQENAIGVGNTHRTHEQKAYVRLICADYTLRLQRDGTPKRGLTRLGIFQALATECIKLKFVSFPKHT